MNKNDCLKEIKARKLLQVDKMGDDQEMNLKIKLGAKIMKQSQLDIILTKMDEKFEQVNTKMDEGFKKVDKRFEQVETKMDKRFEQVETKMDKRFEQVETRITNIETILKRHDDLFVEHGWLKRHSF